MRKPYQGKEPCPGCDRTGEEKYRDTAKSLCQDCLDALSIGNEQMKRDANISSKVIYLNFRHVDHYLRKIGVKFKDDEFSERLQEFVMMFFESVKIIAPVECSEIVYAGGAGGLSCAWWKGQILKIHYDLIIGFIKTICDMYEEKIHKIKKDLKEVEMNGYEQGQNFLINQIRRDLIGESQQ